MDRDAPPRSAGAARAMLSPRYDTAPRPPPSDAPRRDSSSGGSVLPALAPAVSHTPPTGRAASPNAFKRTGWTTPRAPPTDEPLFPGIDGPVRQRSRSLLDDVDSDADWEAFQAAKPPPRRPEDKLRALSPPDTERNQLAYMEQMYNTISELTAELEKERQDRSRLEDQAMINRLVTESEYAPLDTVNTLTPTLADTDDALYGVSPMLRVSTTPTASPRSFRPSPPQPHRPKRPTGASSLVSQLPRDQVELCAALGKNAELRIRSKEMERTADKSYQELEQAQKQVKLAERRISNREDKLRGLLKEKMQWQKELKDMREQVVEEKMRQVDIFRRMEALKREHTAQLEETQDTLRDVNAENEELRTHVAELRAQQVYQAKRMEELVRQAKDEKESFAAYIAETRQRFKEWKENEASALRAAREQALGSLKTEYDLKIARHHEEKQKLRDKVKDLEVSLKLMQKDRTLSPLELRLRKATILGSRDSGGTSEAELIELHARIRELETLLEHSQEYQRRQDNLIKVSEATISRLVQEREVTALENLSAHPLTLSPASIGGDDLGSVGGYTLSPRSARDIRKPSQHTTTKTGGVDRAKSISPSRPMRAYPPTSVSDTTDSGGERSSSPERKSVRPDPLRVSTLDVIAPITPVVTPKPTAAIGQGILSPSEPPSAKEKYLVTELARLRDELEQVKMRQMQTEKAASQVAERIDARVVPSDSKEGQDIDNSAAEVEVPVLAGLPDAENATSSDLVDGDTSRAPQRPRTSKPRSVQEAGLTANEGSVEESTEVPTLDQGDDNGDGYKMTNEAAVGDRGQQHDSDGSNDVAEGGATTAEMDESARPATSVVEDEFTAEPVERLPPLLDAVSPPMPTKAPASVPVAEAVEIADEVEASGMVSVTEETVVTNNVHAVAASGEEEEASVDTTSPPRDDPLEVVTSPLEPTQALDVVPPTEDAPTSGPTDDPSAATLIETAVEPEETAVAETSAVLDVAESLVQDVIATGVLSIAASSTLTTRATIEADDIFQAVETTGVEDSPMPQVPVDATASNGELIDNIKRSSDEVEFGESVDLTNPHTADCVDQDLHADVKTVVATIVDECAAEESLLELKEPGPSNADAVPPSDWLAVINSGGDPIRATTPEEAMKIPVVDELVDRSTAEVSDYSDRPSGRLGVSDTVALGHEGALLHANNSATIEVQGQDDEKSVSSTPTGLDSMNASADAVESALPSTDAAATAVAARFASEAIAQALENVSVAPAMKKTTPIASTSCGDDDALTVHLPDQSLEPGQESCSQIIDDPTATPPVQGLRSVHEVLSVLDVGNELRCFTEALCESYTTDAVEKVVVQRLTSSEASVQGDEPGRDPTEKDSTVDDDGSTPSVGDEAPRQDVDCHEVETIGDCGEVLRALNPAEDSSLLADGDNCEYTTAAAAFTSRVIQMALLSYSVRNSADSESVQPEVVIKPGGEPLLGAAQASNIIEDSDVLDSAVENDVVANCVDASATIDRNEAGTEAEAVSSSKINDTGALNEPKPSSEPADDPNAATAKRSLHEDGRKMATAMAEATVSSVICHATEALVRRSAGADTSSHSSDTTTELEQVSSQDLPSATSGVSPIDADVSDCITSSTPAPDPVQEIDGDSNEQPKNSPSTSIIDVEAVVLELAVWSVARAIASALVSAEIQFNSGLQVSDDESIGAPDAVQESEEVSNQLSELSTEDSIVSIDAIVQELAVWAVARAVASALVSVEIQLNMGLYIGDDEADEGFDGKDGEEPSAAISTETTTLPQVYSVDHEVASVIADLSSAVEQVNDGVQAPSQVDCEQQDIVEDSNSTWTGSALPAFTHAVPGACSDSEANEEVRQALHELVASVSDTTAGTDAVQVLDAAAVSPLPRAKTPPFGASSDHNSTEVDVKAVVHDTMWSVIDQLASAEEPSAKTLPIKTPPCLPDPVLPHGNEVEAVLSEVIAQVELFGTTSLLNHSNTQPPTSPAHRRASQPLLPTVFERLGGLDSAESSTGGNRRASTRRATKRNGSILTMEQLLSWSISPEVVDAAENTVKRYATKRRVSRRSVSEASRALDPSRPDQNPHLLAYDLRNENGHLPSSILDDEMLRVALSPRQSTSEDDEIIAKRKKMHYEAYCKSMTQRTTPAFNYAPVQIKFEWSDFVVASPVSPSARPSPVQKLRLLLKKGVRLPCGQYVIVSAFIRPLEDGNESLRIQIYDSERVEEFIFDFFDDHIKKYMAGWVGKDAQAQEFVAKLEFRREQGAVIIKLPEKRGVDDSGRRYQSDNGLTESRLGSSITMAPTEGGGNGESRTPRGPTRRRVFSSQRPATAPDLAMMDKTRPSLVSRQGEGEEGDRRESRPALSVVSDAAESSFE